MNAGRFCCILLSMLMLLSLTACKKEAIPENTPEAASESIKLPEDTPFTQVGTPSDVSPSDIEAAIYEFDPSLKVRADFSKAGAFEPPKEIYSRLSEEALPELVPSDSYGMLIPYVGAYSYIDGVGFPFEKYGLMTRDGVIVMDAVCDYISSHGTWLYENSVAPYYGTSQFYNLKKTVEPSDTPQKYRQACAIAAVDGSWVTGYDFQMTAMADSMILGILDAENNYALCYNKEGDIVFDTRTFPDIGELEPYSLSYYGTGYADYYSTTRVDDSLMPVLLKDGFYGYISTETGLIALDTRGERLTALPTHNSMYSLRYDDTPILLADNELFGYVNEDNEWVIEPVYTEAEPFYNGKAIVKINSFSYIIDDAGESLFGEGFIGQLEAMYINGEIVYHKKINGKSSEYYDENLEPILLSGENPDHNWYALFSRAPNGLLVWRSSGEVFIEGAVDIGYCESDIITAVMEDGGQAAFDTSGKILFKADSYISITGDVVTGEKYIYADSREGGFDSYRTDVYSAEGKLLATDVTYGTIYDGLFPCKDNFTVGRKNSDNEWVIRIIVAGE